MEFILTFERINQLCINQNKCLILGLDHNLDLLKANHHRPTQSFLEAIYDGGLVPMITKPTRISTTTATLIDNILIDHRLESDSISGILLDNTSDHLPCYALIPNINPTRKKQLEITSRDSRPKNILALKNFLSAPGRLLPPNGNNASEQFDNFHTCLQEAVDHFVPITTQKVPARSIR